MPDNHSHAAFNGPLIIEVDVDAIPRTDARLKPHWMGAGGVQQCCSAARHALPAEIARRGLER